MRLLVEIPEHVFEHAKENSEDSNDEFKAMRAIEKGVPISDGGICDLCKCKEMGLMAVCFHCMAELKGV